MPKQLPIIKRARRYIRGDPELDLEKARGELFRAVSWRNQCLDALTWAKELLKVDSEADSMYNRIIHYLTEAEDQVDLLWHVVSRLKQGLEN